MIHPGTRYATECARQHREAAITAFLFRAAAFVMFGLIALTLCLIATSLIALAVDMPDVLAQATAQRSW